MPRRCAPLRVRELRRFFENANGLLLVAGGDKRTQNHDIAMAIKLARDLLENRHEQNQIQTENQLPWDSALKTDRDIAYYLEAVFEAGDPNLVAAALGDVARAKGMSQIAQAAGLGRESLYKALSTEGNPEFATVLKVMRALELKLKVAV